MRGSVFWKPVVASLILTPIALFLGLGSAGAGHGDYILATFLFPHAMFLITFLGGMIPESITITVAVAQYPVYGLILGLAGKKKRYGYGVFALLAAHTLSTIICFLLRSRMTI